MAVRDSKSCPMAGQCLLENTIYQATVKQEDTGREETYMRLMTLLSPLPLYHQAMCLTTRSLALGGTLRLRS